jgi:hypothetical protein
MATKASTPVVRLSSPAEIVDAVPYLVGFQPENSLVVLSLRGKRNRVGVTARVDLPPPQFATQCADQFMRYLKRDDATQVVVVLYPPSAGRDHPSIGPLVDALGAWLAAARIRLNDVLCVYEGRWWSLQCTNPACCPAEGTPIQRQGTSPLAAAMVASGRVVLASRSQLQTTIQPVGGVAARAMAYALQRASERLVTEIAAGRRTQEREESLELFTATVRAWQEGHPTIGTDDAARLIVALDDVGVRDEVLTWAEDDWGEATRSMLEELVRRAVPPFEVPALTVLAWIAYMQGDGAIAGIAIERALASDPDYGMAQLLDQALLGGLQPATFRSSMRELRQTLTGEAS